MGCKSACICGGFCPGCPGYEPESYCGEAEDIYDEIHGKDKAREEYYAVMEEQYYKDMEERYYEDMKKNMAGRARKKPVEIEFIQFTGDNFEQIRWWTDEKAYCVETEIVQNELAPIRKITLKIKTLEGEMKAEVGDYIIKGVEGEFYPCKPSIFETTYDIVKKEGGEE